MAISHLRPMSPLPAPLAALALALAFAIPASSQSQPAPRPGPRRAPPPVAGPARPAAAADEAEGKILAVLEDLQANDSRGMMNVPPDDGRMLRLLTEAAGARHVVEIGTSNGYSGIWFCLALRKTGGKLTTFEVDEGRHRLAGENFRRAGVDQFVTRILGDAHQQVATLDGPIDVLFLDADKEGYMDYLTKLLPKMKPGGLILAHNTTNSGRAMQDYLQAVTTNPKLETMFIHADRQGLGVTLVKR